jgi:hypothetical protein
MAEVIAGLEQCLKEEQAVLVDTVTLTPTGTNGYSTPEQPTTDDRRPDDSDLTSSAGGSFISSGQPETQRVPVSGATVRQLAAAKGKSAPAASATVEERSRENQRVNAPPWQMHVDTEVSPSDKTVGPDTKTACEVPATDPDAPPTGGGTSSTRSVSATTVLICAAIVGALIGGLAVAGIVLFLW